MCKRILEFNVVSGSNTDNPTEKTTSLLSFNFLSRGHKNDSENGIWKRQGNSGKSEEQMWFSQYWWVSFSMLTEIEQQVQGPRGMVDFNALSNESLYTSA